MKKILIISTLFLTLFNSVFAQKKGKEVKQPVDTTINRMVVLSTDFGDMKINLYDATPQHRDNFIKLVNMGFFDSLLFHRVIKNFMIQGGDPQSKHRRYLAFHPVLHV